VGTSRQIQLLAHVACLLIPYLLCHAVWLLVSTPCCLAVAADRARESEGRLFTSLAGRPDVVQHCLPRMLLPQLARSAPAAL
jgi:hypothetical protein